MRRLMLLGALAGAVLVGSAATSIGAAESSVPPPSIAHFLPSGYRVVKTYRAELSGGAVPDLIVTSARRSSHSPRGADLQVLSWDASASRWELAFDGRSATWPKTLPGPLDSNGGPGYPYGLTYPGKPQPILGTLSALDVSVDQVAFAPLLGNGRKQLVFSGTYVAAGGMQGVLVVVAVRAGSGKIVYAWEGDTGLGPWGLSHNIIHAQANYLAPYDSECCPIRMYRFSLGARAGRIVEVYDDRPFLGVVLHNTRSGDPRVVLVSRRGPAAGRLDRGDVILSVENELPRSRPLPKRALEYSIFDKVSSFRAGQTVRLLIRRSGKPLNIAVKLGSLMDPAASAIRTPTTNGSENAL